MKMFLLGLLVGVTGASAVGYYAYQASQSEIATLNKKLEETKLTKPAAVASTEVDISAMAARLRNQQLDDLSKLEGKNFERHYVMILSTLTESRNVLADEAKGRIANSETRAVIEKELAESIERQRELHPLRVRLNLID